MGFFPRPSMKCFPGLPPLVCLALLILPPGPLRAQTIGEALDAPTLNWTHVGTVTPLNDPALSHDGLDVLRINPVNSGSPWSVQTSVTVPSIVEFWHRSQNLNGITWVGRNGVPAATSSSWKQERWLQFPINAISTGDLAISNAGPSGSGPLFVDQVSISPAAQVTLAEALDFPGLIASSTTAAGFAESWLAPDGVDAVAFAGPGAVMSITLPKPGLIRFRQSGGGQSFPLEFSRSDGNGVPRFVEGGLTWAWITSAGDYQFTALAAPVNGTILNQTPIVLDSLETMQEIPLPGALDGLGLAFSKSGNAFGMGGVSGASGGDAVVSNGEIVLNVSGPCLVKFAFRGAVNVYGHGYISGENATAWNTVEFPVYENNAILTWSHYSGATFWLDAVEVLPPPPGMSLGALLNAPDVVPEILNSAVPKSTSGSIPGDAALYMYPSAQAFPLPVVRLPFPGPSMVSLEVSSSYQEARVRIDGGGWQTPDYNTKLPFRAVVPGNGLHNLEATGGVVLDHFQVIPLTTVPLPEALDAPELVFTTSPNMPWSGYTVPAGSGFRGNHAAFGGDHATVGDPWIQTQVTGPGILRSNAKVHAGISGTTPSSTHAPKLYIDGVLPDLWSSPTELPIGPGLHTARWVQSGSQVMAGAGTLASLDAVSFEAAPTIALSTALDTPGRTWMAGGNGQIVPLAHATLAPDDVDSVHLLKSSTSETVWLETVVNLPCRFSFRGKYIQVSIGEGPSLVSLSYAGISASGPNGFASQRGTIPGQGPARLRFAATSPWGVLDAVDFETPSGQLAIAATPGSGDLSWSIQGGKAWQVVSNESGGADRFRSPNEKAWMETTVMGPGKLDHFYSSITLPDHDNRPTEDGWIPYPGPQRVRVSIAASTLLANINFRATTPLENWKSIPGVTWTTGGDVPWQSSFNSTSRSGVLRPGEVSWIEAAVTGPGVFYWEAFQTSSSGTIFTCNGTVLGFINPSAFVHLGLGSHRLRWTIANAIGGGSPTSVLTLRNAGFIPQPSDSVSSVLSGGLLNFLEPSGGFYANPTVTWPSATGWQIVDDNTLPGKALKDYSGTRDLRCFQPSRGSIHSLVRMEGPTNQGAEISIWEPAAGAPFPWLPWTSTFLFPQGYGSKTSIAQTSFTADTPVSVGDALDQPGLTWTLGSNPPGLWQALSSLASTASDKDALHLVRADMGDVAWLETTVTGPLRVSTDFDGTGRVSSTGIRVLMDGVLAVPDNPTATTTPDVIVPPGVHQLRWEIIPLKPVPALSGIAILSIRTRKDSGFPFQPMVVPDVAALVDAPGLAWTASSPGTSAASMTGVTTGSHDGVDALSLGGNRLAINLTGPGVFSFWLKDSRLAAGVFLDSLTTSLIRQPSSGWNQYRIPIPQGIHSLAIFSGGGGGAVLDEFSFQSLPSLQPEAALDIPPGVTLSVPNPANASAANYPEFGADATGSLLLMPGFENRIILQIPPRATLSLKARSVFGDGAISFQGLALISVSPTWSTYSFSPDTVGGLKSFYLRSGSVPLLLDNITVSLPDSPPDYFPWATAAGLTFSQQQTSSDPDGDGIQNFAEYAFGLNPLLSDAFRTGTDSQPGLPQASIFTGPAGEQFLEVRYWHRSNLIGTLETAAHPSDTALGGSALGWGAVSPAPWITWQGGGWMGYLWRSSTPIAPGTRQFARVRTYLP